VPRTNVEVRVVHDINVLAAIDPYKP